MICRLTAAGLLAFSVTVAAWSVEPTPTRVVNFPPLQPVTGQELRSTRDLLALLLQRRHGVLPAGLTAPETEECVVTAVENIYRLEVIEAQSGESGCSLRTYAR